ncbi:hypothetical protein CIHG_04015 [Coccidioides immitis H538.4]|uniref:Nephrocystin 3-like N-terminal domain-containing protein n=2 Tax=Coccidioides immitis TaxID=5501 RepID=A0A0J8R6G3_COCIT|nr:hypothetical protein CISG_07985 [Coccidioides immitis RMSCC 3703]KMU86227.1 hypothetical protein CIHG_04015 [Coccidioides immitis H538.4]
MIKRNSSEQESAARVNGFLRTLSSLPGQIKQAAIRRLHQLYPPGNTEDHMAVAYYFFQKDNKDERSVNKALRAVIWQLTQRDAVYQKSVAGACDKPEEFGNTLEL